MSQVSEESRLVDQPASDLPPSRTNPTAKRKLDDVADATHIAPEEPSLKKGVAPIKAEFLVYQRPARDQYVDGFKPEEARDKKSKNKGQNTNRQFGSSRDDVLLCSSRAHVSELTPVDCPYNKTCKYEHDIRRYLTAGKRDDLTTFNGQCPVWSAHNRCSSGWRCRFVGSHSQEKPTEDGGKELCLTQNTSSNDEKTENDKEAQEGFGIVNVVAPQQKINLRKRQFPTPLADAYLPWLNHETNRKPVDATPSKPFEGNGEVENESLNVDAQETDLEGIREKRATFRDPPLMPSEKRRIYYGSETPILAPLTTQGNLPFRRLCCELGAQVTWSEMAMSLPLLQGERNEWALMKAHQTELESPTFSPKDRLFEGYDNAKDIKFGAQISGNKPWVTLKTTEVLTTLCPHLRAIDLNCGCPIDLVYRQGAGSALLDSPNKLEKMLRGMNAVSGEVPITAKIRMGTKDNKPTATRLVNRLATGGSESSQAGLGPPGVAAVTLHGRSRQQRYTKSADWSYISECAAIVNDYNNVLAQQSDTAEEPDPRSLPPSNNGRMFFIGNGDCYSHLDYFNHIEDARVDSVMIARGALMKPWIFEEIETGQYLDKSASERLHYIEKYVRYGLDAWGSDEIGVGVTRRFLLEWLSFACRYVPIGLLEHLPPKLQDRPPMYRGRNDLETLMASDDYKDWIKISEMFLGPAHKDFRFAPKHKSNSYDEASAQSVQG